MLTLYTETSCLRTFKIMPRNLNEIVRSWILLLDYYRYFLLISRIFSHLARNLYCAVLYISALSQCSCNLFWRHWHSCCFLTLRLLFAELTRHSFCTVPVPLQCHCSFIQSLSLCHFLCYYQETFIFLALLLYRTLPLSSQGLKRIVALLLMSHSF